MIIFFKVSNDNIILLLFMSLLYSNDYVTILKDITFSLLKQPLCNKGR